MNRSKAGRLPLLLLALACGCGSQTSSEISGLARFPDDTTWPQSLEGAVDFSVPDGEVGDDGHSDVTFGTIETPEGIYSLMVPIETARATGLDPAALLAIERARVTLSGPSPYATPQLPSYVVSVVEPSS